MTTSRDCMCRAEVGRCGHGCEHDNAYCIAFTRHLFPSPSVSLSVCLARISVSPSRSRHFLAPQRHP